MGLKELYKTLYSKGRYLLLGDYKIDRYIIKISMFLVILSFVFIAYENDFDFSNKLYVSCDGLTPCKNPFYIGNYDTAPSSMEEVYKYCIYEWCSNEYLPAGFQFGEKPINFSSLGWRIVFIIITLALIINHLIHNKGKFKGVNLENDDLFM